MYDKLLNPRQSFLITLYIEVRKNLLSRSTYYGGNQEVRLIYRYISILSIRLLVSNSSIQLFSRFFYRSLRDERFFQWKSSLTGSIRMNEKKIIQPSRLAFKLLLSSRRGWTAASWSKSSAGNTNMGDMAINFCASARWCSYWTTELTNTWHQRPVQLNKPH